MPQERPSPSQDEAFITQPSESDRRSFGQAYERIVGLMARLRAANGCPWDRAQDLRTLRPYLIEEAYEVIEALEKDSVPEHKEELGDLLLQVIFHAEIRREEGAFDAADVAHGIADKLVRRHPHVFGDKAAHGPDEAFQRWEEMKAKEKVGRSVLAGVPANLPALLRAQRVQEKAAQVGFDWPNVKGPLDKLGEELKELDDAVRAGDRTAIEHELGDLLFSLVNVARFLRVSSEDALRASIGRFTQRFAHVEAGIRAKSKTLKEATMEEMDALWEEAKAKER